MFDVEAPWLHPQVASNHVFWLVAFLQWLVAQKKHGIFLASYFFPEETNAVVKFEQMIFSSLSMW